MLKEFFSAGGLALVGECGEVGEVVGDEVGDEDHPRAHGLMAVIIEIKGDLGGAFGVDEHQGFREFAVMKDEHVDGVGLAQGDGGAEVGVEVEGGGFEDAGEVVFLSLHPDVAHGFAEHTDDIVKFAEGTSKDHGEFFHDFAFEEGAVLLELAS